VTLLSALGFLTYLAFQDQSFLILVSRLIVRKYFLVP
jgi:hypothetical protein